MGEKKKKIVKTIKVDLDKCNGCRACEMICSAFHATPKYSSNNPERSRIRMIHEPLKDEYLPVYAGTDQELLAQIDAAVPDV
jgi:benzoyl-CoA reductase subunit BamC